MIGSIHFLPHGIDPTQVLPFIGSGQGTLDAAEGSQVTLLDTRLQSSYVGLLLGMGTTFRSDPEYQYTGSVVFRLLLDAGPFLDNNAGSWTSQRGSILDLMPVYINLPQSCRVTFTATRAIAAAQAQVIAFNSTGIMWPQGKSKPLDHAQFRT